MRVWVSATVNVTIVWQHALTNGDSQCTTKKTQNAHAFALILFVNHEERRKQQTVKSV